MKILCFSYLYLHVRVVDDAALYDLLLDHLGTGVRWGGDRLEVAGDVWEVGGDR